MAASGMVTTDVPFGQHLRSLRVKRGLRQGELAKRVEIDVTYLSKIENDKQRASDRVLRSLAASLDVDPAALLLRAGRVPHELQGTVQASLLGDAEDAHRSLAPPRYPTTFIDRKDDYKQMGTSLEQAGSLVTVTGPPGMGKTRLTAELACETAERRPVAWITVRDDGAAHVEAALAGMGRVRAGIVVLDDADRDLHGCGRIARQLLSAGTTVVATSRQPLGIYGERLVRLAPLPVPNRHQRPSASHDLAADPGRLHEQESVRLLLDRGGLARPSFRLDKTNAPAVFDVCRWLDGLPLAIELAAMRLRQVAVADLAAGTRDLIPRLRGNSPDVPDRHASMTAAIDWSFDRLDDQQRTVAIRLSVLESFFGQGDAIEVASDGDYPPDLVEATVMDLVDRSLLHMTENADGHAMYRWLRPIRQYARLRLEDEDDCGQTVQRHRSWIRRVLEELDRDLPRRESEWERLAELTPELVSMVYELPAAEREEALNGMAHALSKSLQFGNLTTHVVYLGGRFSGNAPGVFRESGTLARVRGELDAARTDFESSYRLAAAAGDEGALANAVLDLAENASERLDFAEASKLIDEAETRYRSLKDERGQIEVLNLRGKLEMKRPEPQLSAAESSIAEALRRARAVEDQRLIAYSLHSLGTCAYLLRRPSSARGSLQESLTLRLTMRNQRGVARVIETLALVESDLENHDVVLQLLGAVRQYRHSSGLVGISPWWQERFDRVEEEAQAALGPNPADAAQLLLQGAAMTLAEAGELATSSGLDALLGPVGADLSEPLRRPLSAPYLERKELARIVARNGESSPLDATTQELVQSGGTANDAYRRLLRARLLALVEPIGDRSSDLLCFSTSRYRGVIIPVFTSGRALATALEHSPEWASRPVVEVQLEQLRSGLIAGETVVVNPWADYEYRITSSEAGHGLSIEDSSIDAPALRSAGAKAS